MTQMASGRWVKETEKAEVQDALQGDWGEVDATGPFHPPRASFLKISG